MLKVFRQLRRRSRLSHLLWLACSRADAELESLHRARMMYGSDHPYVFRCMSRYNAAMRAARRLSFRLAPTEYRRLYLVELLPPSVLLDPEVLQGGAFPRTASLPDSLR